VGHADARRRRDAADCKSECKACGTDIVSYISEGFGSNTFARESDTVHHTYSSASRGVEFPNGLLPDLGPHAKGPRDEGNALQTWLRRHDEYDCE
jgi:predicted dithiol-disulfide oxidoreductase (DUF899 family)